MNWDRQNTRYEIAIIKMCHEILNNKHENSNALRDYIVFNRGIKTLMKTKQVPNQMTIKTSLLSKTFLQQIIDPYNKLPKEISMITNKNIFKKWIKIFYNNKNTKRRPILYKQIEPYKTENILTLCEIYTIYNNDNPNG